MRRGAWLLALLLAGCSDTQVARVVADGQLFCAMTTGAGLPLIVALRDAGADLPILAKGRSAVAVRTACAVIGAIPVSPPAAPAAAPVVAIALAGDR